MAGDRKKSNKMTGEATAEDRERPESDFFEFNEDDIQDIESMSKEFLAVKPWKG